MLITLQWIDLTKSQQNNILHKLITAFEKPYNNELLHHLSKRFYHSFVDLFYLENKLLGACIYWKETKYYYLYKLFIITKGYGKQMLQEWIELKKNKCFLWRTTNQLAKGYYGKQISVDIDNAQREYDQNAAEYIEVKSKLETVTRRYKLVERLEKRELKETKNATKVIRLKKKKDE